MFIPRPAELVASPGEFVLGPVVRLSAGPGAERAASLLGEYLGSDPVESPPSGIRLEIAASGGPGYELSIRPSGVLLTASDEEALLCGVQTLRQLSLSHGRSWPCMTVRDAPLLPWRGGMLDVSRHFLPMGFVYEFVDLLALHKLNVFHLHLTDDQGWRMEIEGLPRLTELGAWRTEADGSVHGGFYTQAELRNLVAYAAGRGITVVPEFEMPGHVRAVLAAYPELGNRPEHPLPVWNEWGVSEDILGVHDEALEFCRTVLAQIVEVFPSRYIHIGGEEMPTTQWEASPRVRARAAELGFEEPRQLHGWFLRQMRDFLAERGRIAVCWDEAEENGELDLDIVLAAWRDQSHGVRSVELGHRVVMSPHTSTYLDYPQTADPAEPPGNPKEIVTLADMYAFEPLAGGLAVADLDGTDAGVLGAQTHLWTEYVATADHALYLMFPRLCAFAEAAWSGGDRDFAEFGERMETHTKRLAALGVLRTRADLVAADDVEPRGTRAQAAR